MMDFCSRLEALLDSKVPTGLWWYAKSLYVEIRGEIPLGTQCVQWPDCDDLNDLFTKYVILEYIKRLEKKEVERRLKKEILGENAVVVAREVALIKLCVLLRYLFVVLNSVRCLVAVASKKKSRLKHRYEKATVLILWQSGDVERNPGPAVSDILRDFCKKMISHLVIWYLECKEGRGLRQADYQKMPDGWPVKEIAFGDPSVLTNKERNAMFDCLCKLCLAQDPEMSSEFWESIENYQKIQTKQCSKSEKAKHVESLKSWLKDRRFSETLEQLFNELRDDSESMRNKKLRLMADKLKQVAPDFTSDIYKSWKTAELDSRGNESADHDDSNMTVDNILEKALVDIPVGPTDLSEETTKTFTSDADQSSAANATENDLEKSGTGITRKRYKITKKRPVDPKRKSRYLSKRRKLSTKLDTANGDTDTSSKVCVIDADGQCPQNGIDLDQYLPGDIPENEELDQCITDDFLQMLDSPSQAIHQ